MNQSRLPHRFIGGLRGQSFGFSLVELMITLVIGAFLISAVVLTYLSGKAAATDAEQLSRAQENIRVISEYLVRDIRNSGYVDEVEVLVGHEDLMRRRGFAEVLMNPNRLRVRYAGRGHCGDTFQRYVLVENEYSVNNEGMLQCLGRHVADDANVDILAGDDWDDVLTNPRTVQLLSGVDSIEFIPLNPAGISNCVFDYEDIETTCVGVQINVGLVGPQGDIRELSLLSAFRNVILDRVREGAPAPTGN